MELTGGVEFSAVELGHAGEGCGGEGGGGRQTGGAVPEGRADGRPQPRVVGPPVRPHRPLALQQQFRLHFRDWPVLKLVSSAQLWYERFDRILDAQL